MMKLSTFAAMAAWRPWRASRRGLRAGNTGLPRWALAEVSLPPAQAAWLARTLCRWHALPLRDGVVRGDAPLRLAELIDRLQRQGLHLQAWREPDARRLQRGDVLMLGEAAAERLFGTAAAAAGGMALVVEAGAAQLRLSPAPGLDPVSCRTADLQGLTAGWVLRSELSPGVVGPSSGWDEDLARA